MKSNGTIETNIKLLSKNRVNIELTLLLDKIRTIIAQNKKETLTLNVDNTSKLLTFNFLINDNEIESIPTDRSEFNIS
jgi:hypothetical protein